MRERERDFSSIRGRAVAGKGIVEDQKSPWEGSGFHQWSCRSSSWPTEIKSSSLGQEGRENN